MAHTLTHDEAKAILARPVRDSEQHCEACGAEFLNSEERVQHIWDQRYDEFEYHGNAADIDFQLMLDGGE